ncbi:hypothetical protein ACU4GD_16215 [Cupriavidus basilensis]
MVGAALIGALIVALALVPGLAWIAMRKPRPVFHNPALEWLAVRYRAVAGTAASAGRAGRQRAAPWPWPACWRLAPASAAISCPTWTKARRGPAGADAARHHPGARLRDGQRAAPVLAREFPEVSYMVTQDGPLDDDGTDYWTPSRMIEASVGLHPYKTWASGMTRSRN